MADTMAYVLPKSATIRSDPFQATLIHMREFVTDSFPGMDGVVYTGQGSLDRFWDMTRHFSHGARGLIVY